MHRYLKNQIVSDLKNKMVFLGGPRQVGKSTLALELLNAKDENDAGYLTWDDAQDRKILTSGALPSEKPLIVLDEIHKNKKWRQLVKGLYDKNKSTRKFLITGSARLDYYSHGGDSLQGRYHYLRLHPISLGELGEKITKKDIEQLLKFGGFPEPFLKNNATFWRRWQRERMRRVINEDLTSLERVEDMNSLTLLVDLLPTKVGAPLSIQNIANDLQVSHKALSRWIKIFENMYLCFRVSPFGSPKIRAVKKEQKLYMWDWSLCNEPSARFENLVASQLLKYCHYLEDTEGYEMELRYLRDTDKREIDFVVMQERKPLFAVECKLSERNLSPHLKYYSERTAIPYFYQVHNEREDLEYSKYKSRVLPIEKLVGVLGLP